MEREGEHECLHPTEELLAMNSSQSMESFSLGVWHWDFQPCFSTWMYQLDLIIFQKCNNSGRPSYNTLGCIPKRCPIMPQGHVFHCLHGGFICDNQKLEATQMSHDRKCIQKKWFIYIMEYYPATKNENISQFLITLFFSDLFN